MIKVLAAVDRKSGPETVRVAVRENRFLLLPIDRNELCRATELSAGGVGQFNVDAGKFAVIVHTDNETGANELADMVEARWGVRPQVVIMGPVIGAHVGPGSVSCGWLSTKTRKELTGC